MTYDTEKLVEDLKTICQSSLNTRLAAIDAEKGSGSTPQVSNEAYFFQDMLHERAPSYDVLMLYGLQDPTTEPMPGATAENHEIYFIVVVKETGELEKLQTRMMRYARALKEVFERDFSNIRCPCKLMVSSVMPTRFRQDGVSGAWLTAGVKINTTLA